MCKTRVGGNPIALAETGKISQKEKSSTIAKEYDEGLHEEDQRDSGLDLVRDDDG